MDRELLNVQSRQESGAQYCPPEMGIDQRTPPEDNRSWADRVAGSTRTERQPSSWADQMSDDEMSEINAHHPPSKKARPEPLSEESRTLAKKAFTTTLSNASFYCVNITDISTGIITSPQHDPPSLPKEGQLLSQVTSTPSMSLSWSSKLNDAPFLVLDEVLCFFSLDLMIPPSNSP